MFSSKWSSYSLVVASLYFLSLFDLVSAFDVPYCSTINTANTQKNSSIYQSNGLCFDFCKESYAFAVVQFDGCWCSDYVPGTTTTGCDTACPGYDIEQCGGDNLYGYIQLIASPAGTRGALAGQSTLQVSSSIESTSSVVTTTVNLPSSTSALYSTRVTTSRLITSRRTSTQPSTTDAPETTSSWVATPIITIATITGKVQTVTVTPTSPADAQNLNGLSRKEGGGGGGGLGTGGAVGLTIGLVALAALVGAIIYFCLKKRKQQKQAEEDLNSRPDSLTGLGGQVPSRSMSEHSRYVLGTDGRQVVETWEPDREANVAGQRKSRLMPVDPRLDPFSPVYQRGENKSRESLNTIRDDHDYSRRVQGRGPVLRATNPDE